jgi:hypothetical protein
MFKKFLMKTAMRLKGMPKAEADALAEKLANNPQIAAQLKALESNKEVKTLLEKIQKEIEEKKKAGLDGTMAQMSVMMKYKAEIAKYQDELMPLMELMQK